MQHLNTTTNTVGEENQFKAEFKLLTEIMVSVPKMSKTPIKDYISETEASKDPIENPIPDIKSYFGIHVQNMPKVSGPKAFSLTGLLREQDDQEEFSPPEVGITPNQLVDDELLPHYFSPNFLRPLPVEEVEERESDDTDLLNDELDAIWLIPGTLPEPCWEFSMCFNQSKRFNKVSIRQCSESSS